MYMNFGLLDPASCSGSLYELHTSLMMGDEISEIVGLLDRGTIDVNAPDQHGCTAIHHAALGTSVAAVLALLERRADATARTRTRATALHVAAYNGRMATCVLLVLHGADVHAEDDDGRVPLFDATYLSGKHCPCAADSHEMQRGRVAAFLQQAMDLAPARRFALARKAWELFVSGWLHEALEQGCLSSMTSLLERHAGHIDARDYDGWTCLHSAVQLGQLGMVHALLDHRADISATTNCDETPLHIGAREGHLDVVKLLCAHGADVHAHKRRSGGTPLDEARQHARSASLVAYLQALTVPQADARAAGDGNDGGPVAPHASACTAGGDAQSPAGTHGETHAEKRPVWDGRSASSAAPGACDEGQRKAQRCGTDERTAQR